MQSMSSGLFAGLLVLGGGSAGPAMAVIMKATYRGHVEAGHDMSGLFRAGGDLGGLRYEMTFVYDPSTPGADRVMVSEANLDSDEVTGGDLFGLPSPMRSATVTINRHTYSFETGFWDQARVDRFEEFSGASQFARYAFSDSLRNREESASSFAESNSQPRFPSGLEGPLTLTTLVAFPDYPSGSGSFRIFECLVEGDGCVPTTDAAATLTPETVAIAAVPIPGSLPLIAGGLLGLGYLALYRGRDRISAG